MWLALQTLEQRLRNCTQNYKMNYRRISMIRISWYFNRWGTYLQDVKFHHW